MSNRLAAAASPYLRQHAENPVDWWTWSDAALAAARTENKPILLSIGYSACHWCHVMAHESFEDAATARVMNELFVCIKVDREERPDLDKIYQLAHQALTRRGGGWPLTVFLTPDDHLPFYAGTYFPREARYGMPPFTYVLQQVRAFWDDRRDDVRAQNAALGEFLTSYGNDRPADGELSAAPIQHALAQIEHHFDSRHGGHSGAPKFPHCPEMELLLDVAAPEMVNVTLARMAAGGIHDQIGGGFCRYSVDERWEIPHFEKMLYDNAQLLAPYALFAGGNQDFASAAHGIVAWLEREMTAPAGAFYSALDADSEHEEGKFYVWQRDEVRALLDAAEFAIVDGHFGFDRPPNFENTAWNPLIARPLQDVAQETGITMTDANARLSSARTKLFVAREKRVRPGLDDKILTAWNALMIGALAQAARSPGFDHCAPLAERALEFIHANLWRDGRLLASFAGGAATLPAYLDDHAFLLDALLECLQLRWNARDLHWAIELADSLLERFEDRASGGFFFTAHDHEKLIQRPKSWMDEAVPSGNGIAARALLRLGHLLGETRYLEAAERALRAAYPTLMQSPQACPSLLRALNDFLMPRTHVVIRGDETELARWRLSSRPSRRCDIYLVPADARDLSGALQAQKYTSGGLAYVCRGTNCLAPIGDPANLALALLSDEG